MGGARRLSVGNVMTTDRGLPHCPSVCCCVLSVTRCHTIRYATNHLAFPLPCPDTLARYENTHRQHSNRRPCHAWRGSGQRDTSRRCRRRKPCRHARRSVASAGAAEQRSAALDGRCFPMVRRGIRNPARRYPCRRPYRSRPKAEAHCCMTQEPAPLPPTGGGGHPNWRQHPTGNHRSP